jgi:hypothetical protein
MNLEMDVRGDDALDNLNGRDLDGHGRDDGGLDNLNGRVLDVHGGDVPPFQA